MKKKKENHTQKNKSYEQTKRLVKKIKLMTNYYNS